MILVQIECVTVLCRCDELGTDRVCDCCAGVMNLVWIEYVTVLCRCDELGTDRVTVVQV